MVQIPMVVRDVRFGYYMYIFVSVPPTCVCLPSLVSPAMLWTDLSFSIPEIAGSRAGLTKYMISAGSEGNGEHAFVSPLERHEKGWDFKYTSKVNN
jgi:hypothetical protein